MAPLRHFACRDHWSWIGNCISTYTSERRDRDSLHPRTPMAPTTLTDLYVDELKDLYSAENQILKALPRMIKAATHKELKQGFTKHERQTREHVKRLERICKSLDEKPTGKKCVGMEGVLKEGSELIKEKPD